MTCVHLLLQVIKTRMQLQGQLQLIMHTNQYYRYRSPAHALLTIFRQEGFGALYRGYRATLLRDIPYSAIQFATYEKFKRSCAANPLALQFAEEIMFGAMAGAVSGALTTPLDLIKTRLQTTHHIGKERRNPGILSTTMKVLQSGGAAQLWRGIGPRVVISALHSSFMFVVYENVLKVIERVHINHKYAHAVFSLMLLTN